MLNCILGETSIVRLSDLWSHLGINESELVADLECGGVASFLADSLKSRTGLFI
jgi:hypothetical protein